MESGTTPPINNMDQSGTPVAPVLQQPQVPQGPDQVSTAPTQFQSNRRKKPILLLLLLVLILGVILIGYYFLVAKKQPGEESPLAPQPAVSSQEDLDRLLANLLEMDDFNFEEETEGDFQGCRMVGTSVGRKKGDNQYVLGVSQYADKEAIGFCGPTNIIPFYEEAYWVGEDIYYRYYEDKDFKKFEAGSNIAVPPTVRARLEEFYPDSIRFLSSEDKGQTVEVKAALEHGEMSGNLTFVIGKTEDRILGFSYTMEFAEGGEVLPSGGTVFGEVTITSPAEPITLPSNI